MCTSMLSLISAWILHKKWLQNGQFELWEGRADCVCTCGCAKLMSPNKDKTAVCGSTAWIADQMETGYHGNQSGRESH